MVDAAKAPAAPPAAAPAAPAAEKGSGFKFQLQQNGAFSIDNLLVQGRLEATIRFNAELAATYRTPTADEIQMCEALVDDSMRRDRSAKFVMNELTIGQLYYSLVALNNKAIPEGRKRYSPHSDPADRDPRRDFIRNLPGPLFDLLVQGLNEFDRHAKAMVTKEGIANF